MTTPRKQQAGGAKKAAAKNAPAKKIATSKGAPVKRNPGSGGARTWDDPSIPAAIGRAIATARGDMSQGEVARALGFDQPTLSRLEKGLRPTPLTLYEMMEIERVTNRPAGFILREAGYLPRMLTAAQAIAAEPSLSGEQRAMLTAMLESALSMSGR